MIQPISPADVQPSFTEDSTIIYTSTASCAPTGTYTTHRYHSDYYQLFTVSPQEEYALLGVEVGIPVTFLLTAIISSLLTLLITYQCLTHRGGRFPPPVQEPAYDPVSVSSTRRLETHNNVAYGAVTDSRSASYI